MNLKELQKKLIKNLAKAEKEFREDLAFQVGREIERARITAGLTQEALANKVGTHQSSIARAENGSNLQSLSFLKKIAEAVNAYIEPPKFIFTKPDKRLDLDIKHTNAGSYVTCDGEPYQGTPYSLSSKSGAASIETLTQTTEH